MSVAFRRESDEEHLEPTFELPLPPGPNLVTPRGLAQIEARVRAVEAEIASTADETQRKALERQLRYWQTRQVTAELAPLGDGRTVAFGTRVKFALHGKGRWVELVGHDEAEPASGRIAFSAPLSRALSGAEVGDFLPFNGDEDAIEILEIEPLTGD